MSTNGGGVGQLKVISKKELFAQNPDIATGLARHVLRYLRLNGEVVCRT